MSDDLPESVEYKTTMQRLEGAKHTSSGGASYWLAREMMGILGYERWENFEAVVVKACASLTSSGVDPSHHIADTTKMVGLGGNSQRAIRDMFMSRLGCYLTAMNGDPSKPEIAAAQAYFVIRTREREIEVASDEDTKRLEKREKVKGSFRLVSGVAKEAGLDNAKQPIFHDARYQGLYGMSARDLKQHKGIGMSENPFDRMGVLELSAHDFQMNLAAETIQKEKIKGEQAVIRKNKEVAAKVRTAMIDSGGSAPEALPAAEPIKEVEKRLKATAKAISKPPSA